MRGKGKGRGDGEDSRHFYAELTANAWTVTARRLSCEAVLSTTPRTQEGTAAVRGRIESRATRILVI
jgi:hypothetical protein